MDTKKKIIGAVALAAIVLIMLSIGGTYWSGKNTEQRFRDGMEEMSKYGVKATLAEYKRGIFGATARTELAIPFAVGQEPVTFAIINSKIKHGPLLTMGPAAIVLSDVTLPEELAAMVRETFGSDPFEGKAPITTKTTYIWGGGSSSLIASPKFKATSKDGKDSLFWNGMDGNITVNADHTKIKTKVVMNGLSAMIDKNHFEMGPVTFQDDSAKAVDYEYLFDSTSSIVMDKLSFRGANDDADAIQGFTLTNTRSDTSMEVSDGVLKMKAGFDADALVIENKTKTTIDKPTATFLYENIDARAFDAFLAAIYKDGEKDQQELISALQEQAETLLRRKPAFSVKDAGARWPEGPVKWSFRIAYVGSGNLAQFSAADLVAELELKLPRALLVRLVEDKTPENTEQEEANIPMVNTMIEEFFLAENDDTLSLDVRFGDGRLILNGQEKSPESLQELLGNFLMGMKMGMEGH
jgi:uncharacterized protein YdgA (DUF945 family)